jgi:uncharacterized protein
MKGQVLSGKFGEIIIRQKSDEEFELGELLIAEKDKTKILLQIYELAYGSQISQQNLELISGMKLEENTKIEFFDEKLRNYKIALAKNLITINEKVKTSKILPEFFSEVRDIKESDLPFLRKPINPLFVGNLRSGSKEMKLPIYLKGDDVLSHHVLIPASTGKGKSNLTSVILWNLLTEDYCGLLVLDPHDEYYGRNGLGLKDHPKKEKVSYYTAENVPPGGKTLKINLKVIKPNHFDFMDWSTPQRDALYLYYKKFGEKWIESVILEKRIENIDINEATLAVLKRRLMNVLDLEFDGSKLYCKGVFDINAGETTINDIVNEIEESKIVIVDTSGFPSNIEILIGSLITAEIFNKYKYYKNKGQLKNKPVVSIVIEEAPRVIGKEVLERSSNVFSKIAREGRKFKIGLIAITQLPSLIPREVLANMNTKIILGIEMAPERQAIIESASQDLSADNRNIASLDKGEAIITSNFTSFAIPVKIPLFSDIANVRTKKESKVKKDFSGIGLG